MFGLYFWDEDIIQENTIRDDQRMNTSLQLVKRKSSLTSRNKVVNLLSREEFE
jgi:hypothetical protein